METHSCFIVVCNYLLEIILKLDFTKTNSGTDWIQLAAHFCSFCLPHDIIKIDP
jgi:hypothetical protein